MPERRQQRGRHEGRRHGGRHQSRRRQEVLQLPGGWPPPAPVPIKDGCQLRPGEDGGESPWLLVKRQLCGLVKQRRKETAAAEEATEGGSDGRGRSAWQPGCVHLRGRHRGAQEGEGPHVNVGAHSTQQTGDWKHPVLLRRGGGGRRASGAGQPGWHCSHQGGS